MLAIYGVQTPRWSKEFESHEVFDANKRSTLAMTPSRQVSCGVVITDGHHLLIGHASRSPRWDIPKGLAEPGEPWLEAAVRELKEETGLVVTPVTLAFLGIYPYLRYKDLALFAWRLDEMPAPGVLHCSSFIDRPGYAQVTELDRFGVFCI